MAFAVPPLSPPDAYDVCEELVESLAHSYRRLLAATNLDISDSRRDLPYDTWLLRAKFYRTDHESKSEVGTSDFADGRISDVADLDESPGINGSRRSE